MQNRFLKKLKELATYELNSGKYKSYFFENISQMLASGIDISTILKGIKLESKSRNIQRMVENVKQEVENGTPLWKIFKQENFLGEHLLALVRIGEETGNLPENLNLVVKQIKKDREFKNKLRSASLYPLLILGLLIAVFILMFGFVLPRLTEVYSSFDVELPFITRVMIAIGNFFNDYGQIAIPGIILFFALINYILFINKRTKFIGQEILFKVPGIKNLFLELELSRFGFLMNNLLDSNVSVPDSLDLMARSSGFKRYQKFYSNLGNLVSKGYSFKDIFENYKESIKRIPLYPRELIVIGESSGKLSLNFKEIGEVYEQRNSISLKDAAVIFEPVLLIIVWLGIAFVALSVVIPLYSIIGNISSYSNPQSQEAAIEQVTPSNVITNPNNAEPSEITEENL